MDEELVANISRATRGDRAARTRARLQAAALDLFAAQGFEGTTVEQIAAAAGVSHMTFFRYFPTKESVVVEDPYDPLIAQAVLAQPRALPAFERVRRGMREVMLAAPPSVDLETLARVSLIAMTPALRGRMWDNSEATRLAVVDALVGDGVPVEEAGPAAAACLGAVMVALLAWSAERGGPGAGAGHATLGAAVLAALDGLDPAALAARVAAADRDLPSDRGAAAKPETGEGAAR